MTARREVHSFCRFCSALCGVIVTVEGDEVISVRGDPDHQLTRGYTCAKGRALPRWHHHPRRLEQPMMRRGGELEPVSWRECLDDLAARLGDVRATSGPDAIGSFIGYAVGFDANGRRFTERFLHALGSRSKYTTTTVDMPCKLLVPELMAANSYLVPQIDHDRATLALLFGSNVVVSHGHFVMWPDPVRRLRAIASRGEVWVVDPRTTETARCATRHLAPRAGTDYVLLAHLVRELLAEGADQEFLARHTAGVAELAAAVAPFDLDRTTRATGLAPPDVLDLLASIRRHPRIAGHTGTGVTMGAQGNVAEWLLWSLHAVTGSLDRPGGLWFNPGLLLGFDRRPLARATGEPERGPGQAAPSRPVAGANCPARPWPTRSRRATSGHCSSLVGTRSSRSRTGREQRRRSPTSRCSRCPVWSTTPRRRQPRTSSLDRSTRTVRPHLLRRPVPTRDRGAVHRRGRPAGR